MTTAYRSGWATLAIVATIVAVLTGLGSSSIAVAGQSQEPAFTSEFRLQDCNFQSRGANPYFILIPGYQLVLSGRVSQNGGPVTESVEITVLGQTRNIFVPGVGNVTTRVVQERHTTNGDLVELSKNFFAICDKTNDVFYFGEEVDIFNEDGTITHEGAWLAGVNNALPGLIMPGTFLLGSRYFQEVAPGVALDRAEHVEMGLRVRTAVGTFEDCVKVLETTPLEPGEESVKVYCPGVGLVQDDELELVDIDR